MISAIGGGLTSFGLGVYVFEKTGSAAGMALVTLLGFLPTLLLSVPAGVLADRYDRRHELRKQVRKNYHGDPLHIDSIFKAIKRANSELDMKVGLYEGGNRTVEVVPLGYAGNPKGYEAVSSIAGEVIEVQVNAICEKLCLDNENVR